MIEKKKNQYIDKFPSEDARNDVFKFILYLILSETETNNINFKVKSKQPFLSSFTTLLKFRGVKQDRERD